MTMTNPCLNCGHDNTHEFLDSGMSWCNERYCICSAVDYKIAFLKEDNEHLLLKVDKLTTKVYELEDEIKLLKDRQTW